MIIFAVKMFSKEVKVLAEDREMLVDEDEVRDSYGNDPAGTVVMLANQVEGLRREVYRLSQTVEGLYSVLREVAPDRLSRYELKQQMSRVLKEVGESE